METTPRGSSSKRTATPQLSERKKCLFENKSDNSTKKSRKPLEQQASLDGIRPLTPDLSNNLKEIDLDKSVRIMLRKLPTKNTSFLKHDNTVNVNMFTTCSESAKKSPNRRSPRSSTKKTNNTDTEMSSPNNHKSLINTIRTPENKYTSPTTPKNKKNCTDELGKLFKNSLNFKNDKKKPRKEIESDESCQMSSTDDEIDEIIEETPCKKMPSAKKRFHLNDEENHKSKIIKLDENQNKSIDDIKISTKSFYSNKENQSINKNKYSPPPNRNVRNISPKKRKYKHPPKAQMKLFNKGVRHSIKKPLKPKKLSIDDMLKQVHSEKFKCLPSKRISQEKVDLVHKILAENKNPIKMAKPLNINTNSTEEANLEFSDIDNNSESDSDDNENNAVNNNNISQVKLINEETTETNLNKNRKFFKSERNSSTKKEITIANKIKATFSNGKIALKKKKEKKKKSKMKVLDASFSAEQFQVNEIIANLNVSPFKNNPKEENTQPENKNNSNSNQSSSNNTSIDLPKIKDYSEFSNLIPYNTTDPELIKQQHLLLDFLITNDICNKKNFNIFIADPENHKEEANQICNDLVCVVDGTEAIEEVNDDTKVPDKYESFRKRVPYQTDNEITIQEQMISLDFLFENDICTEENFKIFIAEADNYEEEATKICSDMIIKKTAERAKQIEENLKYSLMETETIENTNKTDVNEKRLFPIFYYDSQAFHHLQLESTRRKPKNSLWRSAVGRNQYQIDAGQKEYGAKQCSQCGLVYTMHEPEEEILHNEYHNSMHILKFRSWIDEEVIADYPEWGIEGRIIQITDTCSNKKRARLMEVLNIVDKELGFSSFILPTEFVAFLAIRSHQIVGLCLVEFVGSANRYLNINGLDCCTENTFEAHCGISRIWISPFHRRLGIATKLILAVQTHAISGEFIDINKIAFSAPTEDGIIFAKKVTKRKDFLMYQ